MGARKGQSIGEAFRRNMANKLASPVMVEQRLRIVARSGTQNAGRKKD